jgi:transposase
MTKYEQGKLTVQAKKLRRANLVCKVIKIKIQQNHLSKSTKKLIHQFFLEAKWLRNFSFKNDFQSTYKIKEVTIKAFNPLTQKCDLDEKRELRILPAQVKYAILNNLKQDIIKLSKAKKKGIKVGVLKPKSEINSIPFLVFGYGATHYYKDNKIKLAGLPWIKINGLDQIPKDAEYANANLIRKPSGLYIHQTIYVPKEPKRASGFPVGIDFGIKDSIVLSNGESFDLKIPLTKNIRRKNSQASKKLKSKNRSKAFKKLKRAYERYTNKKEDDTNQLIHKLKEHDLIVFQDENIKGWQSGLFGRSVQLGSLGRIKTVLKRTETAKMISRFVPTTQMCPKCSAMHKQSLSARDYSCSCGFYHPSRDVKAALTALTVYVFNLTPLEQRSLLGEAISYTSFFELFQFLEKKQDKPITQEARVIE